MTILTLMGFSGWGPAPSSLDVSFALALLSEGFFRCVYRFCMAFNRTDLRKSVSGVKFDAEPDFEVCSAEGPPKSIEHDEKLSSKTGNDFDFCLLFFLGFWYRQRSFKAENLTTRCSRRPRASCASVKFAKLVFLTNFREDFRDRRLSGTRRA